VTDLRIPDERAWPIIDPRVHADEPKLYEAYEWLRKNQPLGKAQVEGFDPFWMVVKHADILEVSKDSALFPYGNMPSTLTNADGVVRTREMAKSGNPLLRTLVQMDEPEHMKYRALTQAWFMPQNVKKLEGRIRELARGVVGRMEELGGECDFVNEVALHYPLRVIMEILGVPHADEPRMLKLTQELFGAADPDLQRKTEGKTDEERMLEMQQVITDFFSYFNAITEDRKKNPVDDVASVIANAKIDGQPISPFDAISYYVIIATAGHDTTSSSTAGAMHAMARNPGVLAQLRDNPGLTPGLVDESIRWTTPVKHFMRQASADTELRGRKIAKDDWLMLCYPSGNRDEEVFEDPYTFRVDRSPNKHLAFGYGAHLCLGQHLAKMEMRILWEVLPRLSKLEIAGDFAHSQANFVGGLKKLPIRYKLN
jgi:cytochrome P450